MELRRGHDHATIFEMALIQIPYLACNSRDGLAISQTSYPLPSHSTSYLSLSLTPPIFPHVIVVNKIQKYDVAV